jgi:hypothetical protein
MFILQPGLLLACIVLSLPNNCGNSAENHTIISVDVDEASPTLKVKAVFTNLLTPYPAEITQLENQYVRLNGNHYFLSPYETTTQKTVFKLASSNIESFSKLSPFSTRGSNIHFGPYKDIAAFSVCFVFPRFHSQITLVYYSFLIVVCIFKTITHLQSLAL